MGYLSYGHECIIFIVSLLLLSHVLLDLVPMMYRHFRHASVATPIKRGTRFILILSASFLL